MPNMEAWPRKTDEHSPAGPDTQNWRSLMRKPAPAGLNRCLKRRTKAWLYVSTNFRPNLLRQLASDLDQLYEVAAGVIQDGLDAPVGFCRRPGEHDALIFQSLVLLLNVLN